MTRRRVEVSEPRDEIAQRRRTRRPSSRCNARSTRPRPPSTRSAAPSPARARPVRSATGEPTPGHGSMARPARPSAPSIDHAAASRNQNCHCSVQYDGPTRLVDRATVDHSYFPEMIATAPIQSTDGSSRSRNERRSRLRRSPGVPGASWNRARLKPTRASSRCAPPCRVNHSVWLPTTSTIPMARSATAVSSCAVQRRGRGSRASSSAMLQLLPVRGESPEPALEPYRHLDEGQRVAAELHERLVVACIRAAEQRGIHRPDPAVVGGCPSTRAGPAPGSRSCPTW